MQQPTPQLQPQQLGDAGRPPPPPPKGDEFPQVVSGPSTATSGPPLPPLPPGVRHDSPQYGARPPTTSTPTPTSNRFSRYDSAPPLPPQHPQPYQQQPPLPQAQAQAQLPPQQQQQQHYHTYSQGGPPPHPPQGFPPDDSRRPSVASTGTPYNAASIAGPPPPGHILDSAFPGLGPTTTHDGTCACHRMLAGPPGPWMAGFSTPLMNSPTDPTRVPPTPGHVLREAERDTRPGCGRKSSAPTGITEWEKNGRPGGPL